jgi:hypothetical protein
VSSACLHIDASNCSTVTSTLKDMVGTYDVQEERKLQGYFRPFTQLFELLVFISLYSRAIS